MVATVRLDNTDRGNGSWLSPGRLLEREGRDRINTDIASVAKQSRLSPRRETGLLCCARNDEAERTGLTPQRPQAWLVSPAPHLLSRSAASAREYRSRNWCRP